MSMRRPTMVEIDRRVSICKPPNYKLHNETAVTFADAPSKNAKSESPKLFNSDGKRHTDRTYSLRRDTITPRRRNTFEPEIGRNTPDQEEIINDEILYSRLQKMFEAAEEDGQPGLTIDTFTEAMLKTVGRHNTKEEIQLLFMKVDDNCDGLINWGEYVTYNLLEYKEKSHMIELLREKPFPNEVREIASRHREIIVKIIFYPNVRKSGPKTTGPSYKSGKYMTLSKEGVVGVWDLSMRNMTYHNANHYQNRSIQPWFTDMVALYNVNMLAVTSADRDISIFDLTGKKFNLRYFLNGFDHCITAMDYWVDLDDLDHSLLLFGDTSGSITSIKFESAQRGALFGAGREKKKSCKRICYAEITRGFVLGVKAQKLPNIHEDWVNKVMYLPDIQCFLSSCGAPQTALFFGDFVGKKSHAYFKVNRGVLSFDYSHSLNIIVTGGMDYSLRVWNPYVNNKAIVLLKGHTKPVNHVIIYEAKNQVISIDKGRSLRVYDLRDQTCVQQISGRIIKFDPFPISAAVFNPAMQTALLAANQIVILEKKEEEEGACEIVSHKKAVVAALYNKVFDSIVSACQESVVNVWETSTGIKLMQFVNAHCTIERGYEIPVEITAMCFDYNGRRLITGARNGTIHVWNFNNGSLMQHFELPDNSEVTGIVCSKNNFFVCGWGKKVYIYIDGSGEDQRTSWADKHHEDILSIAILPPNLIATGSYDGDIIVLSQETGHVFCRLNAFKTTKPNNLNGSTGRSEADDNVLWQKGRRKLKSALGVLGIYKNVTGNKTDAEDEPSEGVLDHPLFKALDPETRNKIIGDSKLPRDTYENICKNYESAIEKIIFLETREPLQRDTAIIVTSGAEGWIRFWSMHHEGGLLGQFKASHRQGESVFTIKSDCKDQFLFTGDTEGYVKVWDICEYCTSKKMSDDDHSQHIENLRKKFTFFRVEFYKEEVKANKYTVPEYLRNVCVGRPPPSSSNPKRTFKYPMLVNSFRAHVRGIHSVDYVNDRELLITASADCSVRLWTINGQYIGTFGGERWRQLPKLVTNEYFLEQIPNDIRRSGSARTLKVMHGGKTPRWENAIGILKFRGIERLKKQLEHLQDNVIKDAIDTAKEHAKEEPTSNILGKSYKKTMRHRMTPSLPKFIETKGTVAVYHALKFVDLTPVEPLNDAMKDIQERRTGSLALNKFKGIKTKKPEVPALMVLFNKMMSKKSSPLPKLKSPRIKKVADKLQSTRNSPAEKMATSPVKKIAASPAEKMAVKSRDKAGVQVKLTKRRDEIRPF